MNALFEVFAAMDTSFCLLLHHFRFCEYIVFKSNGAMFLVERFEKKKKILQKWYTITFFFIFYNLLCHYNTTKLKRTVDNNNKNY